MTASNFYEQILAAITNGGYADGVSGDRLAWFTPEVFSDILANILADFAKISYAPNFEEYTAGFSTSLSGLKVAHLRIQYVSDDDPANKLTLSIGGATFAVLNPGGVVELPGLFQDSGSLAGVLSNTAGNHRILVNLLLAI
jgi:hypothetical protein